MCVITPHPSMSLSEAYECAENANMGVKIGYSKSRITIKFFSVESETTEDEPVDLRSEGGF